MKLFKRSIFVISLTLNKAIERRITLFIFTMASKQLALSSSMKKPEFKGPFTMLARYLSELCLIISKYKRPLHSHITARKFHAHFNAHLIRVQTEFPLDKKMKRLEKSRSMVSWAHELMDFDVKFLLRVTIKDQVFIDFIIECKIPEEIIIDQAKKLP